MAPGTRGGIRLYQRYPAGKESVTGIAEEAGITAMWGGPAQAMKTAGPVPGVRPVCESLGRGLSFPADSCCQALALAI